MIFPAGQMKFQNEKGTLVHLGNNQAPKLLGDVQHCPLWKK